MEIKLKYKKGISGTDLGDIAETLRAGSAVHYACRKSSLEEWYSYIIDEHKRTTVFSKRSELVFETQPFPEDSNLVWVTVQQQKAFINNQKAAVLLTADY